MVGFDYVKIGFFLVSMTGCLARESDKDIVKEEVNGTSTECHEALTTCALPLFLPYVTSSGLSEVLETARNIQLSDHCRRTLRLLTCYRDLIGKKQCSDLDPETVRTWNLFIEPIWDDFSTYICRTEYKKFSIHYRCLLTEEVFDGLDKNCSSVDNVAEAVACVGGVIKEQCGSTASKLSEKLLQSAVKQIEKIGKVEVDEDDIFEEEEDYVDARRFGYDRHVRKLATNAYGEALIIFKKLLERK